MDAHSTFLRRSALSDALTGPFDGSIPDFFKERIDRARSRKQAVTLEESESVPGSETGEAAQTLAMEAFLPERALRLPFFRRKPAPPCAPTPKRAKVKEARRQNRLRLQKK